MALASYIERITVDTLIHNGPCILYSIRPTVAITGELINVYEGQDAQSGILREAIDASAHFGMPIIYTPGAYFANGLYIDIGTAGDTVTVCWGPVPPLDLG